jgi:glycolate oxidase
MVTFFARLDVVLRVRQRVPQMSMQRSTERALLQLTKQISSDQIITDAELLESYARDESETAPCLPEAVVRARSQADVVAVMQAAHAHQVFVTPRAAGTGRTGGAVPIHGGIVLSFEGMSQIEEIHRADLVAVVEPGVVLKSLHDAVESEGLFYGPDPNSLGACAIGGNLAENAGGPRAFKYGVTRDWTLGLDVVTADGTALTLGKRSVKGVTGYDLAALVVGSEGTLAVITRATLKLMPLPERVVTLLALLPDVRAAGAAVSLLLARGIVPRCLELMDAHTLGLVRGAVAVRIPDEAGAALLLELDGPEALCEALLEQAGNLMLEAGALDVAVARHGGERERLWAARRELSHALRRTARFKLAEDVVVPRSQIPALLDARSRISEQHRIAMPTYGHAGDGNLHVNFLWNDPDEEPRVKAAIEALFREVVRLRGTLTGEHGIGVLKAPYLHLEQSPELIAFQRRIKATFDPKGILNPGKIVGPDPSRPAWPLRPGGRRQEAGGSAWCLVLGAWCLVLGAWCLVARRQKKSGFVPSPSAGCGHST